jgi:hypothetical protein
MVGAMNEPRPPGLRGDRGSVYVYTRLNLKDRQVAQFVRELALWLNRPHGLVERDPPRSATDRALYRLLVGMSTGEAKFYSDKILEADVKP